MNEINAFLNHMDWASLCSLILRVAAVLACIVIHEVSHGVAAYWLGDPTAKSRNRLSLNPLCLIDPLGALMMLLVGFGWAKPVPVDMRYFKHPKSGMAVTALAGPISNFILAYAALLLAWVLMGIMTVTGILGSSLMWTCLDFLQTVALLSVGLGVFNLIPFPPLDGSKVVEAFLPDHLYYRILRYEFAGMIILMLVLWSGWLDAPLTMARITVFNALFDWASWPYRLIQFFA